jgi:hypothetical protein
LQSWPAHRSRRVYGRRIDVGGLNQSLLDRLGDGAAYLFTRSSGTWTEQQKLIAADPEAGARLGNAVELTPGIALVGAPFTDAGAVAEAGAVCSYEYADWLFADGFESGDTIMWSVTAP